MVTTEVAIGIGARIAFTDRGVRRWGQVVGVETVGEKDRDGRRPGRWFVVKIAGQLFETADVHDDAVICGG